MKARFLVRSMTTGHVATDYLRLVHANQNPSAADKPPQAPAAHAVLELFDDQDRPLQVDPIVPIKRLVMVLTQGLRGMPDVLADDDGRINGASLYRGCRVRMVGIPERLFIVHDVYWDDGEARIKEKGKRKRIEYVVPWNCLELAEE